MKFECTHCEKPATVFGFRLAESRRTIDSVDFFCPEHAESYARDPRPISEFALTNVAPQSPAAVVLDCNGRRLQIGDRVTVEATVEAVSVYDGGDRPDARAFITIPESGLQRVPMWGKDVVFLSRPEPESNP